LPNFVKQKRRVVIAGGGAAGFFAAIACAESAPDCEVWILEKGPQFLAKVRISGGGRCNVTHACFDGRVLSRHYPRGERALIGAFHRFQPNDTVTWFEKRGVRLKTERDGRMFPVSDSSETVIECLRREAQKFGVQMWTHRGVERAEREVGNGFWLTLSDEQRVFCDYLLLATGGCRAPGGARIAADLGHSIEEPVPSLFTFHVDLPWLRKLPGLTVETVVASVPGTSLRESGPLLITHSGVSGPVILRLSAWGARILHSMDYRFPLQIRWLPSKNAEEISTALRDQRAVHPARLVVNTPLPPLPARLWEQLLGIAGVPPETRWNALSRSATHTLAAILAHTELPVTGKSLNKEEFVTCGGIRLREINFKTMESSLCPRLYFAGELLDVDGITGGFNFQAAWTTGWIAGKSMAENVNAGASNCD
jgi:predicted Rossmann fold flavoprotein